jgi:hypothetical protein
VYRGPLATSATSPGTGALFGIGEIDGNWAVGGLKAGRVGIGYWGHTGYAPLFAGGVQKAPTGWYATLEQRLTGREATDNAGAVGLTVFAKYGRADDRISDFAQHFMLGLVQVSPFGVDGHAAGIMVSAVDLSDQAAAGHRGNETTLEAFYRSLASARIPDAAARPAVHRVTVRRPRCCECGRRDPPGRGRVLRLISSLHMPLMLAADDSGHYVVSGPGSPQSWQEMGPCVRSSM